MTLSKTMGSPPTDLNARTGELTPPGMTVFASAMMASDLVVTCVGVAVADMRMGDRVRAAALDSARATRIWERAMGAIGEG